MATATADATTKRRKELLALSARLFAERGFAGTSVGDIAREFGVRKASLYHWITSKDALLAEILHDSVVETAESLTEIMNRDLSASERLRLMVREHIESWVRNPHTLKLAYDEGFDFGRTEPRDERTRRLQQAQSAYKKVLEDGVKAGEFMIPSPDISLMTQTIVGSINNFPRWYRSNGSKSSEQIADFITDTFLLGLKKRD
jgi:AcrR family transcriptional regulator